MDGALFVSERGSRSSAHVHGMWTETNKDFPQSLFYGKPKMNLFPFDLNNCSSRGGFRNMHVAAQLSWIYHEILIYSLSR